MKNKLFKISLAFACLLLSFKIFSQVPLASFALSQTNVCAGGTVQITDLSINTPTAWSYTVQGIALPFTTQNPVITFSGPGTFSIHLIASNVSGNSSMHTETISVSALPLVSAGTSTAICEGTYISFNGSGADSYSWSDGVIDGTSFAPISTTIYTVTGTNLNGCENSATITVTVNPLPVLVISGPTVVCEGAAITLTVSGANTYTWDGGSIHTTTLTDIPLVSTTYSVVGKNTMSGCENSTGHLVNVNDLPVVYVNSGSICSGKSFTMNPGGASSYTFSNGIAVVSPTSSTIYTITGADANGCSAKATSEVTVFTLPLISVNSGTFCTGTSFTILPTGASVYSITPGNSFNVSPAANTSYSITGTDLNGCVSATAAVSNVTPQVLPLISVNSGSICLDQVFTMTTTGAQSYTFSNGSSTVSPLVNTTYTVIGENAAGCISLPVVSSLTVVALPVITVNSGSICAGQVFTMNPAGASTYTFVNGTTTVNPLVNTSYSVTGTSSVGCISPTYAVSEITVHAVPVVSVNSGSICIGETYTLIATGADNYIYQGNTTTVSPSSNAVYTVTGISNEGCTSSNTASAVITVNALPTLSVAGSTAICIGKTATLTVSGASTYTWSTNSNLSSITVTPQVNTGYTVSGTSLSGCNNSTTYSIHVNSLPVIGINSGSICPGSSFTLTPSGATSYTYSGGSNVVSPLTNTSYSVSGTDIHGCISSVPAIATVSVAAAVTVAVTGNTVICAGQTASLTASGASTYSWSTQALTNTVHLNPTSTSSYTVTGMISSCSNSMAVSVSVNPVPSLSLSSSSTVICSGETATLISSGADSYSWGGGGQTGNQLVITPVSTTAYTVTGTSVNSCTATAIITQSVNECTGIEEDFNPGMEIHVYPNPTAGEFTVKSDKESLLKIYNLTGQIIYTSGFNGELKIDLDTQPDGLYFAVLKQGSQSKTIKILKH